MGMEQVPVDVSAQTLLMAKSQLQKLAGSKGACMQNQNFDLLHLKGACMHNQDLDLVC